MSNLNTFPQMPELKINFDSTQNDSDDDSDATESNKLVSLLVKLKGAKEALHQSKKRFSTLNIRSKIKVFINYSNY